MEAPNPYAAPQADIAKSNPVHAFDSSSVFSPRGRFSRLSYLAWITLLGMLAWVVPLLAGVPMAEFVTASEDPIGFYTQSPLILIPTLAFFAAAIIFQIRRYHDFNASGWWSAVTVIPIANLIAGLVLMLVPGRPEANSYGPPRITRGWEKAVGLLLPILFLLGIIAAITIPAYTAYVQAARQATGTG